jgi:hypothetical protein
MLVHDIQKALLNVESVGFTSEKGEPLVENEEWGILVNFVYSQWVDRVYVLAHDMGCYNRIEKYKIDLHDHFDTGDSPEKVISFIGGLL